MLPSHPPPATFDTGCRADLLTVDGLNRDLSATYNQIDHRALHYLKQMEARTKERLLTRGVGDLGADHPRWVDGRGPAAG